MQLSPRIRRLSALGLVLLLFGTALVRDAANLGGRYQHVSLLPYLVGTAVAVLALANLWSVSRYAQAERLAGVMAVAYLVGWAFRLVDDTITVVGPISNAVVVLGALVLGFGTGKPDADIPVERMRRRAEARGLPRLNRRRAARGLPPVTSFEEARADSRRRRRGEHA
jgi:hypothetical protein